MSESWESLGIDLRGRTSGELHTRCPKNCSAKPGKKDLSVNLDDGVYKCWNPGCGFQGRLRSREPRRIARSTDYDPARFRRPDPARFEPTIGAYPDEAIAYMAARGISVETLRHFRVGWTEYGFKDERTTEWRGAFLLPFYRGDELINVKKRSIDKQFVAVPGAELIYFNLNAAEETTIIVEGELDVLAYYEAGITNVISVPNGAASGSSMKLEYINNCGPDLDEVRHFVISTDADAPGMQLRAELVRRLGMELCSSVEYPEGCKDANDVLLLEGGPELLRQVIAGAHPFPVSGIARPSDLRAALDNWRQNGLPTGVSTGWANLDEFWRPIEGEMTIVTGVPSHGKSSWCDALLWNLYEQHGWRSIVFSPESSPIESHTAKMLEISTGKLFDRTSASKWAHRGFDGVPVLSDDEYQQGLDVLEDAIAYIVQLADGDGVTLDQILELARSEIYRRGSKVLVLDPWNEIEHDMMKSMSETLYISAALSKIRRFARHNGVHTFVIAHPTKMTATQEKYQDEYGVERVRHIYPVPGLYHISGGANWANKADNGISVWRDEHAEDHGSNPHLNTIEVTKVKRKQIGRKGGVQLLWDPPTGRYGIPTDEDLKGRQATPVPSVYTRSSYDDRYEEADF